MAFLETIQAKLIAAAVIVLLIGGAIGFIYHKGEVAERDAAAARTLDEAEKGRKARETNDEKARSLDDQKALDCLKRPTGC
jgi:hypothetical protein